MPVIRKEHPGRKKEWVRGARSVYRKCQALEIRIVEFASPFEEAHRDEEEPVGKIWSA